MKMPKVKDGVLEMNVNLFIIPNGFTRVGEWCSESQNTKIHLLASEILENAGIEAEDSEITCQVWIHNEEIGIENMSCHTFMIEDEDGDEIIIAPYFGNAPAKLFIGKREGDVVDIKFSYPQIGKDDNGRSFHILLHAKLLQMQSRYRSFGAFETVFDTLMSRVSQKKMAANGCEAAAMEVD